jgi:hypothetical protein
MFNLLKTPQALMAPGGCMVCQSAKFPLLDLMQEFSAQQLRLYLCRVHAKEVARGYGFIKGDEMDSLMRIRDEVVVKEQELSQQQERLEMLAGAAQVLRAEYDLVLADRDLWKGRSEQLQGQLDKVRQDTMATLAATNGGDDDPLD